MIDYHLYLSLQLIVSIMVVAVGLCVLPTHFHHLYCILGALILYLMPWPQTPLQSYHLPQMTLTRLTYRQQIFIFLSTKRQGMLSSHDWHQALRFLPVGRRINLVFLDARLVLSHPAVIASAQPVHRIYGPVFTTNYRISSCSEVSDQIPIVSCQLDGVRCVCFYRSHGVDIPILTTADSQ